MNNDKLKELADSLTQGTTILSPLELNEIRFDDKKTVITPEILKHVRSKKKA